MREDVFRLTGLADDAAFLAALRGGVESIATTEPDLEQVFLSLTRGAER